MHLTRSAAASLVVGMALASAVTAASVTVASAADVTGVTDDTIKVGVFGPMTGPAAAFGKGELGIEAIYKSINDAGGINGRKIQIVQEDTACDPAKGIAAVKKLISQDKVFMIHGGSCSNVVLAVEPLIVKAGLPYMDGAAAASQIAVPVRPNVFQPVPNTDTVGRAMVDFAMSKPDAHRIAIISHPDEWGKSNYDPAVAQLKSKYHLDPVLDLSMARGSTDSTPQVLKLRNAKPDVIIAILYPAELAIFERDAYKYGLHAPVIGNQAISIEDTRKRAGGLAVVKNLYVYYPLAAPANDPSMEKWKKVSEKYFPDMRVETSSLLGMGGAVAMADALKRAGRDLTGPKLIDALNHTRNLDTGVLGSPITFTPQDHAGVKGGQFITYEGDRLVLVKRLEPKTK